MIPLESPRWAELKTAYGSAGDIPALLRSLEFFPEHKDNRDGPWFSLWSALAHQGDVYSASFAAVPHIVRILESDPRKADFQFFAFPASVEICRQRKSVLIPADLEADYFDSLKRLPSIAATALADSRDETFIRAALSAIAAATGQVEMAEVILDLSPDVLPKFREWIENR